MAPPVWIVTDGKIGDVVQCRGVAAGLSGQVDEFVVAPRTFYERLAPWGPADPKDAIFGVLKAKGVPAVVIASGRRAIPYAREIKKAGAEKVFVAILKDPRIRAQYADLIWAPLHDHRSGDHVFSTLTSPHGMAGKIAQASKHPSPVIAALPPPVLGVVLGGPSGGARYGSDEARALACAIETARVNFASVAITPSRRTPASFTAQLRDAIAPKNLFLWDGSEKNPYHDILGVSSTLIVAADSHNMMSEAVSTRAGVYAWRPPGLAKKLDEFVCALEAQGRVRPFNGIADAFDGSPIDATAQIIDEIQRRRRTQGKA
ncbi:MAG: mitochondrial fission ELM1 family protein [Pseudomonadota bacterium]